MPLHPAIQNSIILMIRCLRWSPFVTLIIVRHLVELHFPPQISLKDCERARLLRHSALTRLTLESSDVAPTFMVAARSSRICFAAKQSYQKLTQLSAVQCNAVFFVSFLFFKTFWFLFLLLSSLLFTLGSDTTSARLLAALLQQRLYNSKEVFTCNYLSLIAGR